MRGLEVFIMIFDDLTHPALYDSGFYVGEEDGHVLVFGGNTHLRGATDLAVRKS